MQRRLVVASAIVAVVTAAFLPGSGLGSRAVGVRGAQAIPAGLVDAIHARLGAGTIQSGSAARPTPGPELGFAVAVSADGTTALVGAPGVNHSKGAAYIFHVSDAGSWASTDTPTAVLTNKHHAGKEPLFGLAVALSADGTTAFVGAPLVTGGGMPSGAIYAFHASAEDAWASTSNPAATLIRSHDFLIGIALALSPDGTTLVAGAPFYNSFAGGAYVFHVSSEAAWASTSTPVAVLTNVGENPYDTAVGEAVAMSGDGATVLLSDRENPSGGGAYLYHVSAEDAWTSSATPTAILSDSQSFPNDSLGGSLALSGDGTVAVLGALGVNSGTGAVDIFHAAGAAAWASTSTPTATLTNAGGSANDVFGVRVAVSTDGTTALVTAAGVNGRRGAAYIFHVADEGSWASTSTPTATLSDSSGHADDILAIAALSGDGATAFTGAPGVRFETGAVHVFHVADASSWLTSSTPTATLADSALDQCVVPKLKGLTVRAAKADLKTRSCGLGKVKRVHARGKKGRIVSQSEMPYSRFPVGTKIGVKVEK